MLARRGGSECCLPLGCVRCSVHGKADRDAWKLAEGVATLQKVLARMRTGTLL